MHERLRDTLQRALPNGGEQRGSQARHVAAIQDGHDAILIAATGSGKFATMFVQICAVRGRLLGPISACSLWSPSYH